MSPLVRRPILKKFLIVVSCSLAVCVSTKLALAQHPAARNAGGVVHISAPPISHVPISSAPIIHAPIIYAPISTPRISTTPSAGALGTAVFRPPWRPIRRFRQCWSFTNPPLFLVDHSGD